MSNKVGKRQWGLLDSMSHTRLLDGDYLNI